MQHSTNPYLPEQHLDHNHILAMVSEAMQDWAQRKKTPFTVEGPRGKLEVKDEHLFKISGIVRHLILENTEEINRWLKKS